MKIVPIADKSSFPSIEEFDCGSLSLNAFLRRCAKQNDERGIGKTFLAVDGDEVIGFFTIAPAQIEFSSISEEEAKGLPRYPLPAVRIARLAVAKNKQGKGIGQLLLREAFQKIAAVSEITGVHIVLVDAKEASRGFYEHFRFRSLLSYPSTYFLPVSTIKKAMKQ